MKTALLNTTANKVLYLGTKAYALVAFDFACPDFPKHMDYYAIDTGNNRRLRC